MNAIHKQPFCLIFSKMFLCGPSSSAFRLLLVCMFCVCLCQDNGLFVYLPFDTSPPSAIDQCSCLSLQISSQLDGYENTIVGETTTSPKSFKSLALLLHRWIQQDILNIYIMSKLGDKHQINKKEPLLPIYVSFWIKLLAFYGNKFLIRFFSHTLMAMYIHLEKADAVICMQAA